MYLSSIVVAIMVAAGAGAWVFEKTMRRTGGNTKSALLVSGVAGGFSFVLVWSVMSLIDNYLGV
jgi:hypothetical protein